MFCCKCGTQLEEGSVFCHKCGTKVLYTNSGLNTSDSQREKINLEKSNVVIPTSYVAMASAQVESPVNIEDNSKSQFKEFVDKNIRNTTKFQSVEDILTNSKPWTFAWVCIGALTLIGLILGIRSGQNLLLSMLLFGGFFGYGAIFIVSAIIRRQYRVKFYGEFEQEINFEEFLAFLNENLRKLSPDFHECRYLSKSGGLLTHIENIVSKEFGEITLCCEFGPTKSQLATICIRPDVKQPNSGRMQYFIDAEKNGFSIDGRGAGFLGHACLMKTAPIMQAAIEYYLKHEGKIIPIEKTL